MKKLLAVAAVLLLSFSLLAATSAEARRFGGGQSFGMRRAPLQQRPAYQAAPQPAPQPARMAPAPAPLPQPMPAARPGMSRWLGPLAGLAAGAGLMALLGGHGFGGMGGGMGGIFMLLLAAGAGFMIFNMMRRRNDNATAPEYQQQTYEAPTPVYQQPVHTTYSTVPDVAAPVQGSYPPDFDPAAFLRQAKVTFLRMQAANDAGDLHDIRDYTTPEFYAEIAMQLTERGAKPQQTDVLSIEAELVGVEVEDQRTIASLRFTGQVREEAGQPPVAVDEIWHVVRDGAEAPWRIAGMQQAQEG